MKLIRILFVAAILSVASKAALADALIQAKIIDFPLAPGATGVYTYAMSYDGFVGGGISNDGFIVRWRTDGTPGGHYTHILPFPAGHDRGIIFGANFDGSVVVGSSYDTNVGQAEAFRWISDGTLTGGTIHSLGFLPGTQAAAQAL